MLHNFNILAGMDVSYAVNCGYTVFCKPDDCRRRPKHVAELTSCRFATLICMLCKDGSV